jgi:hypothetical protein
MHQQHYQHAIYMYMDYASTSSTISMRYRPIYMDYACTSRTG